jgi:hypothetical protein
MGGMMGESKFDVLNLVPYEVKPKTIFISFPVSVEVVLKKIQENLLSFPLIFKPDLGERGWMVNRINNEEDVKNYLAKIKIDFLIQELVDLPLEFGVFYVRMPDEEKGKVVSITAKDFLSVKGDGIKTLGELILAKDRAKLQWETLRVRFLKQLNEIVPKDQKHELGSIGNHCLGTTFLNGNNLITPKLNDSFDHISKQVKDFYFGRYDLRCASLEDLENGKVKIVELNGCGAEPAHIYQPGASLIDALKVLYVHWRTMYRISKINHNRGVPYLSFREGRSIFNNFKDTRRRGAA